MTLSEIRLFYKYIRTGLYTPVMLHILIPKYTVEEYKRLFHKIALEKTSKPIGKKNKMKPIKTMCYSELFRRRFASNMFIELTNKDLFDFYQLGSAFNITTSIFYDYLNARLAKTRNIKKSKTGSLFKEIKKKQK